MRGLKRICLVGLFSACGAGTSVALTGCDQGCDVDATCVYGTNGGGMGGDGCPEDPADGAVRPDCGIWVSASSGDNASPGTQEEPVQTLAQGIALAQGGSKRVYACGEVYKEAVVVPSGISLFGGFDCEHAWRYVGTSRRATIVGAADEIPLIFPASEEPSTVGDLEVRAADAVKPGTSSIAVLVQDYARGSLRRADLFSARGADGADGVDGGHDGVALDGLPGKGGADACTEEPGQGGDAVKLDCGEGRFSLGGPGGDGGELVAGSGGDGLPLPDSNAANYGVGGMGEAVAPMCTGGQVGIQGAPGSNGAPVPQDETRHITNDGVVLGGDGGDGEVGDPGQGGGGGGGSFGKMLVCGAAPSGGAGGGSGGTGGCGGRGGKGGQHGGSSIALAVRSESFAFTDIHATAANGGNGGRGGQSQPGGQGGLAGVGGQAYGGVGGVHSGCAGGNGGNGGNGGYGAGGRGGDSTGVAEIGVRNVALGGKSEKYSQHAGHGGKGGDPASPEMEGKDGVIGANLQYDP